MTPRCWAVLPAAGTGSRMGSDIPKQYLPLSGATLIEHSLRALLCCDQIAGVVVPLHAEDHRAAQLPVFQDTRVRCVEGAGQRSESVLAGLRALCDNAFTTPFVGPAPCADDWVLVHDAARPCLTQGDLARLISAVIDTGLGGILAQPVVDTIKRADAEEHVQVTVDREGLWRAQTPQMFALGELIQALEVALTEGRIVTDEASVMEQAGLPVQLVPGSASNLKVTVAEDLPLAEFFMQQMDD